jgi:methylase of polypeptide subunit release factors
MTSATAPDQAPTFIHWQDSEGGAPQQTRWRSLAGHPAPTDVVLADDSLRADDAYQQALAGTALLWVGDYQNARHLLQAMGRRMDVPQHAAARALARTQPSLAQVFAHQRAAQAERARVLGALLLPFDADHGVPLRRAPDVREAGLQAHGPVDAPYASSLRELLGVVGAYEWRKKGVKVPALGADIHPWHGVFSPVRGEYVDLIARTKLPAAAKPARALDVGCGTGVLSAVLAKRGLWVVATDNSLMALACAAENLIRLELADRVTLQKADLFTKGRFGLVVCNPPWVPAPAHSHLDAAVYDPDSRMLRGFLSGLAAHLAPGGEGWLILSDLAEHLGLRSREELLGWVADAGLQVLGKIDTEPRHPKAADDRDPLHAARSAEVTSLWRLGVAAVTAAA